MGTRRLIKASSQSAITSPDGRNLFAEAACLVIAGDSGETDPKQIESGESFLLKQIGIRKDAEVVERKEMPRGYVALLLARLLGILSSH